MTHSIFLSLGAAALLGLGTLAFQSTANVDRPDCPGQITCPQTGEVICRDQCPLDVAEKDTADAIPACCRD